MWATGKETANLSNYLYHQILNMPSKVPIHLSPPLPKEVNSIMRDYRLNVTVELKAS